MERQTKRHIGAAASIALMFFGAFILPTTALGFVAIGAAALFIAMLVIMALVSRHLATDGPFPFLLLGGSQKSPVRMTPIRYIRRQPGQSTIAA